MPLRAGDFESPVSANSTIRALLLAFDQIRVACRSFFAQVM
jgi:hypothetical protein